MPCIEGQRGGLHYALCNTKPITRFSYRKFYLYLWCSLSILERTICHHYSPAWQNTSVFLLSHTQPPQHSAPLASRSGVRLFRLTSSANPLAYKIFFLLSQTDIERSPTLLYHHSKKIWSAQLGHLLVHSQLTSLVHYPGMHFCAQGSAQL